MNIQQFIVSNKQLYPEFYQKIILNNYLPGFVWLSRFFIIAETGASPSENY